MTSIRKGLFSLFKNTTSPLSANDILAKIEANKSTIYREIEVLLKSDYLIEVDFADGIKRYELASLSHHHHLVCLKCHAIQDVVLKEDLSKDEAKIGKDNKFKIVKHSLEFFGYCQNCI